MAMSEECPAGDEAMPTGADQHRLSERLRMEIFRALVDAQDRQASVTKSRSAIAVRYGITVWLVRQIEDEGIEKQWPPLRKTRPGVPLRLPRGRPSRP
jgi:hypothetical protein